VNEDCVAPEPRSPALVVWGVLSLGAVVVAMILVPPEPGLHGSGPWVALSLVAFAAGILVAIWRGALRPLQRVAGLVLLMGATWALSVLQPDGPAVAGIYVVIVVAGMGLPRTPALLLAVAALAGEVLIFSFRDDAVDQIVTLVVSAVPWFLVMRLVRELQRSRADHAESAAAAERGRVARDLHDVLAHSLSALAIQLEGARLLARSRNADPELIGAVDRAHHLAAGGLAEARQAIGALHGDELPGPERLRELAEGFADHSHIGCDLHITGAPGQQSSEARLALYRTAQEALTNVRKHSAAERVEVRLDYAADGTTLVVQDFGSLAPVAVGAPSANGGGYGLSGMRERAELLGGKLSAGPTDDGFRVELWLPT
jgi:signal transduction histidine kinase